MGKKELALFVLLDRNTSKTKKGYRTDKKGADQMRNRTPKLLALALAAVMTMGMTVSAATIEENPWGETMNVAFGDTLKNNYGYVMNNHGTILNNYGNVFDNYGTIKNNIENVYDNYGIIENNIGVVNDNYGGTVNGGTVFANHEGTVNGGDVTANYGGTVNGGDVFLQYYKLPTPKNFSYSGEYLAKANNSWWIGEDTTVTITADEGYHFASTPTTTSGTVTEVEAGKTYTLSGVTKNLANGGLTLDVQEGEYTPEQPEPEPEPEPTPTPDPTPTTPPADTSTAAEPASAPTVQQMEQRERPDPQDVEATERYNFWMGVKVDLRAAADGKTLRVYVPADYTNMPASVMEQIRLQDEDIVVDLRWSGEQLIITPATAQRKTALKAFWTFEQLCELYGE